jgi:hypothetical protein
VHFHGDLARATGAAEIEMQHTREAVESEITMRGIVRKVAKRLKTNARQPSLESAPIAGQRADDVVEFGDAKLARACGGEVPNDAVKFRCPRCHAHAEVGWPVQGKLLRSEGVGDRF